MILRNHYYFLIYNNGRYVARYFLEEVIESLRFHENNMGREHMGGGIDEIRLAMG